MRKQSMILILAMCATAAQSDLNFTVGGTPVRLGESQQTVLNRIGQTYQVRDAGANAYVITDKKAPGLQKVGMVTFENGRLSSASSTWGETFGSDGVRFAKELVAAVGNQEIGSARIAIIRPIQREASTGFELLIGDRTIEVVTSPTKEKGNASAQYASIMETLHNDAYVAAIEHSVPAR